MCLFAVIDGAALKIDDKLRVAKERREEQDKQQGKASLYHYLHSLKNKHHNSCHFIALQYVSVY